MLQNANQLVSFIILDLTWKQKKKLMASDLREEESLTAQMKISNKRRIVEKSNKRRIGKNVFS